MRNTISELIKEVFSNIEGKYFGKGIAKLMNIPDFGSMSYFERYGWIEKNVGPKIGSGSVRTTFQIKEKPDLCIKILNFNSNIGRPINQKERYSFKMYPDLFPKVYAAEPSGDWIIVDGVEGEVVNIGLRTTMIRSGNDTIITMPNSNITNSVAASSVTQLPAMQLLIDRLHLRVPFGLNQSER